MQIRIEASGLPGLTCAPGPNFAGARNIHVGVQRKDRPGELLGLQPGNAPSATWTLDCTAVPTSTGADIKGKYIQSRLGGQFVYLSWVTVDETTATSTMFRRAKLMFDACDPDVIKSAMQSGCLTARLRLTDAKGQPLCAAVRPPLIEWSAVRAH